MGSLVGVRCYSILGCNYVLDCILTRTCFYAKQVIEKVTTVTKEGTALTKIPHINNEDGPIGD